MRYIAGAKGDSEHPSLKVTGLRARSVSAVCSLVYFFYAPPTALPFIGLMRYLRALIGTDSWFTGEVVAELKNDSAQYISTVHRWKSSFSAWGMLLAPTSSVPCFASLTYEIQWKIYEPLLNYIAAQV